MPTGKILAYCEEANAGVIECDDRRRYYFNIKQWLPPDVLPVANQHVTFEDGGEDGARKVNLTVPEDRAA